MSFILRLVLGWLGLWIGKDVEWTNLPVPVLRNWPSRISGLNISPATFRAFKLTFIQRNKILYTWKHRVLGHRKDWHCIRDHKTHFTRLGCVLRSQWRVTYCECGRHFFWGGGFLSCVGNLKIGRDRFILYPFQLILHEHPAFWNAPCFSVVKWSKLQNTGIQKFWNYKRNTLCTKLFTEFVQYVHCLSRDMFADDT
jgi:hypothetical protein